MDSWSHGLGQRPPWYIPNPISAQHPVGSLAEYNIPDKPGGRSFRPGK